MGAVTQDVAFKNLEECSPWCHILSACCQLGGLGGHQGRTGTSLWGKCKGPGVASRNLGDLGAWPAAALCLPILGGSLACLLPGLGGNVPRSTGHGRGCHLSVCCAHVRMHTCVGWLHMAWQQASGRPSSCHASDCLMRSQGRRAEGRGPGAGPRLCTTQALTYMHLLVHVRLCAGTRGVGGVAAALHRKSLLVSVSKGRFCGGSAVSHLGISPVQLLLPSLETVFPD